MDSDTNLRATLIIAFLFAIAIMAFGIGYSLGSGPGKQRPPMPYATD